LQSGQQGLKRALQDATVLKEDQKKREKASKKFILIREKEEKNIKIACRTKK
jgi:hypothetical protein